MLRASNFPIFLYIFFPFDWYYCYLPPTSTLIRWFSLSFNTISLACMLRVVFELISLRCERENEMERHKQITHTFMLMTYLRIHTHAHPLQLHSQMIINVFVPTVFNLINTKNVLIRSVDIAIYLCECIYFRIFYHFSFSQSPFHFTLFSWIFIFMKQIKFSISIFRIWTGGNIVDKDAKLSLC